ncbi:hypothetical protein RHSIM_Rhsim06G0083100 [Rhododendron simsii]|uniref:RRM domain-containing protein n=1 Tax=Rhododendron simsii TaxID=118357 RepID=A0A834GSB8_RHOSS|nr:hypothetical protein RHSIM_Rhsim06G0083100 [Rhododendron simsii]
MSHFGRAGPPDISDTYSLLVLNISFRTSADDLFPLFDKYGKVVDVFIPRDRRTGDSRGFAFVRYKYADEAQKAVDKLDGRVVDGREIMVQFAKYGPNAERIHKGRIVEPVSRSRSQSPRPSSRYRDEYRDRDYRRRSRSRSRGRYDRGRERDYHRRSRSHSGSPDYRKTVGGVHMMMRNAVVVCLLEAVVEVLMDTIARSAHLYPIVFHHAADLIHEAPLHVPMLMCNCYGEDILRFSMLSKKLESIAWADF